MTQDDLPWVKIEPSEVGEFTYIREFTHISQFTKIGKFCSIGNLCTIGAQHHHTAGLTTHPISPLVVEPYRNETLIGNDVWIGCNVVVLAGVKVGNGAVIGAGSVVTKDVPPFAFVVGNPARVVRYRFSPKIVAEIQATKWWDLPIEALKELPFHDLAKCMERLRDLTP